MVLLLLLLLLSHYLNVQNTDPVFTGQAPNQQHQPIVMFCCKAGSNSSSLPLLGLQRPKVTARNDNYKMLVQPRPHEEVPSCR